MPLVACPKCSSNLRVPDGPVPAVRCPKCQTVFQPPRPAEPAFEVVEEEPEAAPPPPPKSGVRTSPPPSRKPAPARPARTEEDEEDSPRARPKKGLSLDDEDEDDDRPRSRRRGRDYDDEDDDDRPRRRRKGRRDYDDEDDYDRPSGGRGGGTGPARVGLLLLAISLWSYLGSLGLMLLFLLLMWIGVLLPYGLFVIPGLAGLANWIVALVGLGFSIAGPSRARGLAIAALSVAVVHLILTFISATDTDGRSGGTSIFHAAAASSLFSKFERAADRLKKNPGDQSAWKEIQEQQKSNAETLKSWEKPSLRWEDFGTVQLEFDSFIADLIYSSKKYNYSEEIIRLLAGACELARLILVVLLIRSLARAVKAGGADDKAGLATLVVSIGAVACMVILLLFSVIAHESKWESLRTPLNLALGAGVLVYLIHTGSLVLPALAAQEAQSAAARRARR